MRGEPIISTITRKDEDDLAFQFDKSKKSLEEVLRSTKSKSPNRSKIRPVSSKKTPKAKSPPKVRVVVADSEDALTKEELLERLEMKANEEKEIDLNATNITGANTKLSKSKKELSKSLIANLDQEFDNLKFKRSAVMAERDKMRKDQIKQALEDDEEDMNRVTFSKSPKSASIKKAFGVTSKYHKEAYENIEDYLNDHKHRMEAIEREYKELANDIFVQAPDKDELIEFIKGKNTFIPPEGKRGKENLKNYSKIDPPPSLNSYMVNPFLMRKKKETPKEQKLSQLKTLKKKRDDLKTYKEKFLEYLEDKKERVERKQQEEEEGVSPGFQRIKSLSENKSMKRFTSIERMSHATGGNFETGSKVQSKPTLDDVHSTPKNHRMASPSGSVKKLPSKMASEKRLHSHRSQKVARNLTENEYRALLGVFTQLRKGEKPTVSKEDIWDFIMKNPQLFEFYGLDLMSLHPDIQDFPSEFKSALSFEEFVAFLKDPKATNDQTVHHVISEIENLGNNEDILRETYDVKKRKDFVRIVDERTRKEMSKLKNQFENFCLLPEECLDIFRQAFHKVAFTEDESATLNVVDFVQRLRQNEDVKSILKEPAVYVSESHEYVPVEKVLRQIENHVKKSPKKKKKAREVTDLDQFLKFFTNYELDREADIDQNEVGSKAHLDDGDVFDIQPDRLQFFKDVYDSLPKNKEKLVETAALLDYLRETEYFKAISSEVARQKAALFDLPEETLTETFARLEKEVGSHIKWQDFEQYFTRRGRPWSALSMTDIDRGKYDSRIDVTDRPSLRRFSVDNPEIVKMRLTRALEEEEDDEDDINPTVAENAKYMRYNREDKDVALNKKVFKEALEAADQEAEEEAVFDQLKREAEERRKADELKKKVYGSKFGALYKDSTDYKITEPAPFAFDLRDKNKEKSIRERKLEEMLLKKEQDELDVINVQFRANPVPGHVHVPLFQHIMQAQEERRLQVKTESIAITKARENPFSFYERDMDRQFDTEPPLNSEFEVKFRANPVPDHVRDRHLWSKMQEQMDAERIERIQRRTEENYHLVSLPPRMAEHEREREQREMEEQMYQRANPNVKPRFMANPIPDFERLQRNFQDTLDEKRKSKRPTEPQPFAFQETRKGVVRHYMDIDNQMKKAAKDSYRRDPLEAAERLKMQKPKIQPATTKKMLAMVDKLKKDREEREMRIIRKKQEEQERLTRYLKLKPRVQASQAIVDKTTQKLEQDRMIRGEIRRNMLENQRRFEEEMHAIQARVDARPLLVEQETEKNTRLTKKAMREMVGYDEEPEEPQYIDINQLTPAERAYLEQVGYLKEAEVYEGVAEEEEEAEEDDEAEQEQQRQHAQRMHNLQQSQKAQKEQEEEQYEKEEGEGEEYEQEEGEEYEQEEGEEDQDHEQEQEQEHDNAHEHEGHEEHEEQDEQDEHHDHRQHREVRGHREQQEEVEGEEEYEEEDDDMDQIEGEEGEEYEEEEYEQYQEDN